jgi:hypothetical protein
MKVKLLYVMTTTYICEVEASYYPELNNPTPKDILEAEKRNLANNDTDISILIDNGSTHTTVELVP